MKKNICTMVMSLIMVLCLFIMSGCSSTGQEIDSESGTKTTENSQQASDNLDSKMPEYRLIAAHVSTEKHSFHIGMMEFKKQVEEKSNGRIEIEVHPNGELGGNEDELVQKMATGTVDVIISAPSFMAQSVSEVDLLSVPYLFQDVDHWEKVMDGDVGKEMSKIVEEKSGMFHVLGYFKDGVRSMYTIKPVHSMDDMKDLKFRIQNSPTQVAFWTELGVQPTFVAFNEIYQALQNGVIDGAENSYSQIYQQKHYEVCKNVTETEHDVATRFFLISKSKYDSMPSDLQAIIDESAEIAVKKQREEDAEMSNECKQMMIDAGVNFIQLEKQPLIEKTEHIREDAAHKLGLDAMLKTINSLKK